MVLTLNQLFLNTDPEGYEPPEIGATAFIYDIDEFRKFVTDSIETYQNLANVDNANLDIIEPLKNETG